MQSEEEMETLMRLKFELTDQFPPETITRRRSSKTMFGLKILFLGGATTKSKERPERPDLDYA